MKLGMVGGIVLVGMLVAPAYAEDLVDMLNGLQAALTELHRVLPADIKPQARDPKVEAEKFFSEHHTLLTEQSEWGKGSGEVNDPLAEVRRFMDVVVDLSELNLKEIVALQKKFQLTTDQVNAVRRARIFAYRASLWQAAADEIKGSYNLSHKRRATQIARALAANAWFFVEYEQGKDPGILWSEVDANSTDDVAAAGQLRDWLDSDLSLWFIIPRGLQSANIFYNVHFAAQVVRQAGLFELFNPPRDVREQKCHSDLYGKSFNFGNLAGLLECLVFFHVYSQQRDQNVMIREIEQGVRMLPLLFGARDISSDWTARAERWEKEWGIIERAIENSAIKMGVEAMKNALVRWARAWQRKPGSSVAPGGAPSLEAGTMTPTLDDFEVFTGMTGAQEAQWRKQLRSRVLNEEDDLNQVLSALSDLVSCAAAP